MNDPDYKALNKEIGELMLKYKLRGFVGMIYAGTPDNIKTAVIRTYDPTSTIMGAITGIVSDALTEMNNKVMGSFPSREHKDIVGGSGKEN